MSNRGFFIPLVKNLEQLKELISDNTHLHFAYKVGTEPINKIGDRTTPVIIEAYGKVLKIKSNMSPEELKVIEISSCNFIFNYLFWSDLIDADNKEIYRKILENSREEIDRLISVLKSDLSN